MKNNSTNSFQKPNKGRRTILQVRLLIASVFTIEFAGAQPGTDQQNTQSFTNIPYKKTSSDSAINLDIFLPDSSSRIKHPVVVLIHGGGWAVGDKSLETTYYMQRLKSELLKNRFAVISIDY